MKNLPIKESIDNLPSGICFFEQSGFLVLCNRVMYRLLFELTGRDLQTISDITELLDRPEVSETKTVALRDGRMWRFTRNRVCDAFGNSYTEYVAIDVTALLQKQTVLQKRTIAQEQLVAHMKTIVDNVIAITREEEILSMKMQIHHEIGWSLQAVRRFYFNGCPEGEKEAVVSTLTGMICKLQGEIGQEDETNLLDELQRAAATIGISVVIEGEVLCGGKEEELLVAALRECVTNTLRHARGTSVLMRVSRTDGTVRAILTNDGQLPTETITERGGFSSLRRRIEGAGGTMTIQSFPQFQMEVTICQ